MDMHVEPHMLYSLYSPMLHLGHFTNSPVMTRYTMHWIL